MPAVGDIVYKTAEGYIRRGLSPAARVILAVFSGLCGLMMFLAAPPTEKAVFFHLFGTFCLLISLACVTRGRVRQFAGSLVGCALFLGSLVYLCAQLTGGRWFLGGVAEPSVGNAILFFLAFGVPGIAYALRVRFGLKRRT